MNQSPENRIRVVVVDDQPLERTGNALILDSDDELEVVGEAANGIEALGVVAQAQPDIVLMDARMPLMDGLEATKIITERHPQTRVIVLTTFDLDEYAFGSLRAGASAFLLKSTRAAALIDAVKTVASGAAVAAPRLTSQLIEHYLRQPNASGSGTIPAPSSDGVLDALSPRERDVFELVVQGLSNSEISAQLILAQATVKSHINSIFAKLALRDRVHAVILGYELRLPHHARD